MEALDRLAVEVKETRQRYWGRIREWLFLGVLAMLSLVLLVIQYRWTGELSRAEGDRLRAGLEQGLQAVARSIDSELQESCLQLLPAADEIERKGRDAAHSERLEYWKMAQHRPCFKTMAIAVPETNGVVLMEFNPGMGRLDPTSWPTHWLPLREQMELRRLAIGSTVPTADPASAIIEYPVFSGPSSATRRPRELEWLILELDLNYVRDFWMPDLARAHLNPGAEPLFEFQVRSAVSSNIVYSSGYPAVRSPAWKPDATARCFSVEFPRRRSRGETERSIGESGRWLLEGRCRDGQLEKVVARARWRNLGAAGFVNVLILAAGISLVRQTRESRRVSEAQMNFVAGVSHELRTPLTVIRSAAHNLLKNVVQDPARKTEYARLIETQAVQLSKMIEQVLTFASLSRANAMAGRWSDPPGRSPGSAGAEPSSLEVILERCATVMEPEIRQAGCRIELQLPQNLPPVIAEAASLERVFQNLIGNAAKHAAAGGWIGVRAQKAKDAGKDVVEICISDKGPGIPPEEQAMVFAPFFRGERARKNQVHGSGLGLSVVAEIVRALGGTITVHSGQGCGAEFCVRLPSAPTHPNP